MREWEGWEGKILREIRWEEQERGGCYREKGEAEKGRWNAEVL